MSPGITDDHFHNEGGGPGVDLSHVRSLGELLPRSPTRPPQARPATIIVSNSDWHEAQLKEQRLPTAEEIEGRARQAGRAGARRPRIHSQHHRVEEMEHHQGHAGAGGRTDQPQRRRRTDRRIVRRSEDLVTLPRPKPVSMDDILATQKAVAPTA